MAFGPGQADVTFNAQDADNGGTIPGTQFWTLGSSQPWVLADPVRPGTIYVIDADDPDNIHGEGDDADVVLARSTDYGLTWTVSTVEAGPVNEPGTIDNSFQLFPGGDAWPVPCGDAACSAPADSGRPHVAAA
jgi:hypothetical protein